MKITLYTITDCQFSKQEKEYLTSHNFPFEEKNLETNREFLTEMLTLGNNFAGTPLTKIEKDDGQIVVLKGFTKAEFDKTFGFEQKKQEEMSAPNTQASPQPNNVQPQQTPVTAPTSPQPQGEPPTQPVQNTNTTPPTNDPMQSILNNLQQQSTQQAPQEGQQVPANGAPAPTIPDPQF